MNSIQTFLDSMLTFTEFFCAIVALFYYRTLKNTYWKWFIFYLVLICLLESISFFVLKYFPYLRKYYYDLLVIPSEFIFLYWLYAYKSLQKRRLFWICTGLYLASFIPHLFFLNEMRLINSMSYTMGNFLIMVLVVLEFMKQIKSDNILMFQKNKMFYINIGVVLFYVGTLPFLAFDQFLFDNSIAIWSNYYTFFLLSCNLMYLSFAASFIWGKPNLQ